MTEQLPAVNAVLNGASAICLCAGYLAIRRGRRSLHIRCMIGALVVSCLFLASYLTYHALHGSTRYAGDYRAFYLAVLLTHTVLAAANVPLVVITVVHAARRRFDKHRRIACWTLPIWLYVSVTGVLIYLWLSRF